MKPLIQLAAGFVTLFAMHGALAGTIADTFVGNDAHGHIYGDVIGNSTYDINSAQVTRVGNVLKVVINTNFAGNAGGSPSIGYGDLFLSNMWNPTGTSTSGYTASDATSGTVWKYALHIDDTARTSNTGGALSLYQLNGANNAASVWNSDHYLAAACGSGCAYRNNQVVGVNTDTGTSASVVATNSPSTAKWTVGTGAVTFTMDVSGTALMNYSSFAIHWGETCQNDIIEGATSVVPEPASLALLGIGLCGVLSLRRRRTS